MNIVGTVYARYKGVFLQTFRNGNLFTVSSFTKPGKPNMYFKPIQFINVKRLSDSDPDHAAATIVLIRFAILYLKSGHWCQ